MPATASGWWSLVDAERCRCRLGTQRWRCGRVILLLACVLILPAWLLLVHVSGNGSQLDRQLTVFRALSDDMASQLLMEGDENMFRYIFDWIERPSATCYNMQVVGGTWLERTQAVDGDKRVCLDSPPLTISPQTGRCLVYSFGVGEEFTFETAMRKSGCEIHAFDPTVEEPETFRKLGIHFYKFGLSGVNRSGPKIELRTLDSVIDQLDHTDRTIHYLKVDIEASEYDVFAQQLRSKVGRFVLDKVEQIALEIHLLPLLSESQMALYESLEDTIYALDQLGFRVVFSAFNPSASRDQFVYPGLQRPVHRFYEILLVKMGKDYWDRRSRHD